jgi:hypothetical protein
MWQGRERFHAFMTHGTGTGWSREWSPLEKVKGAGRTYTGGRFIEMEIPLEILDHLELQHTDERSVVSMHSGLYDVDSDTYGAIPSGSSPSIPRTWALTSFSKLFKYEAQLRHAFSGLAEIGLLLNSHQLSSVIKQLTVQKNGKG